MIPLNSSIGTSNNFACSIIAVLKKAIMAKMPDTKKILAFLILMMFLFSIQTTQSFIQHFEPVHADIIIED